MPLKLVSKQESPVATAPEALADDRVVCPLCHTPDPAMTREAVEAGGRWQCGRCSQSWDAAGLNAHAAYAAWAIAHDNERQSRQEAAVR